MEKQPKYRFYATLINAYEWYKESESETAFQEFIDKINRVPFVSEAAAKGTAFNNLVDAIAFSGHNCMISIAKKEGFTKFDGFDFPIDLALECAEYVQHGTPQIRESGIISTMMGDIEVYGEIDYILPVMEIVDLKTTKSYNMPKYIFTWQHIVYPYCFYLKTGLEPKFTYLATDFKGIVNEQYLYNHKRDFPKLLSICIELAEFVNEHRHLITDKKIFNLHE